MNNIISVFTDAATSSQTETSIGAFLYLEEQQIEKYSQFESNQLSNLIIEKIIYHQFQSKKSTGSEIKNIIEALYKIRETLGDHLKVIIYTDCQSFCDLVGRRKEKLEKNNFITSAGKVHANAELYKELFAITRQFEISAVKIKGHDIKSQRVTIQEKIFAILDHLTRKKLREVLSKN